MINFHVNVFGVEVCKDPEDCSLEFIYGEPFFHSDSLWDVRDEYYSQLASARGVVGNTST